MQFSFETAPRGAELSPKAAGDLARILSHYAARTVGLDEGDDVYKVMSEHALAASYDSNTGGGVWLSYTLETIGAEDLPVLIVAGWDVCTVYAIDTAEDPLSLDLNREAGKIWDMCGDDESVRLAMVYLIDNEQDEPCAKFARYCTRRQNEASEASEREFWRRLAGSVRKAATM